MKLNTPKEPPKSKKSIYWQEKMNLYKASGLTQRDFCKRNDLSFATFTYWRSRLLVLNKPTVSQDVIPIEVTPSNMTVSPQCLRIKFPHGILIECPSRLDEKSMRTLFLALGVRQ